MTDRGPTGGSGPTPRKMQKLEAEADDESLGSRSEGEEEEDEELGDPENRQAVAEIEEIHNDVDVLNEKGAEEVLQIEQKYEKMRKPHLERRSGIIEKIPHFWLRALQNHPEIRKLIDEEEDDCLHFLIRLEVEDFENIKSGFRIKFYFDKNPFFENQLLVKEFHLEEEPVSTSTVVQWKEGMDLTKRKKRKFKFFTWLSDHTDPASDSMAEVLKYDLWASPLQYYLGFHGDEIEVESVEEVYAGGMVEGEEEVEDDVCEEDVEEEEGILNEDNVEYSPVSPEDQYQVRVDEEDGDE